jgi:AcrR family transcriptional regulator
MCTVYTCLYSQMWSMSTSSPKKRLSKRPVKRPAPPKAYHHGNLREALITEGLAVLAGGDQADISLRELARRAGVSPNAAYRHFADKEALLAALAAEGYRRLGAAGARAASSDAQGRLSEHGRFYVDFARKNPGLFRLMFGGNVPLTATEELERASTESFAVLQSGIAAATGLPFDDPKVVVGTLRAWSVVHGLAHLVLDGQLDVFADKPDHLIDLVLGLGRA